MFASTLLRTKIKNTMDRKSLARGGKEKYKPPTSKNLQSHWWECGFHMEAETLSHFLKIFLKQAID